MKNLNSKTVLFLEDNETFAENTIESLKMYFHEIIHCISITSAKKLFDEEKIDLIISDIKVEDGNSLEFIQYVRATNTEIPIIVLSAHKDEDILLKAIPLGLISYEIKPLNFEKFKSLLAKCSDLLSSSDEVLENGIYYDKEKKELLEDDKSIKLTKNEAAFIELLLENRGKTLSNESLTQKLWGGKSVTNSALKNLIFRLRKKTANEAFSKIQNFGYQIN